MAEETLLAGSQAPGSTPSTDAAASPAAVEGTERTESTPATAESAQPAAVAIDKDALALKLLDEGRSVLSTRKTLDKATPASDSSPDGAGNDETESTDVAAGESEAKASKPPQRPAPAAPMVKTVPLYDGLEPKSIQALSQTSLLPEASEWAVLPARARSSLLEHAKTILAERTRLYQQRSGTRQTQTNPAGNGTADDTQGSERNVGTNPAPTRGTGQEQPGGDWKQQIVETFGEDGAKPLIDRLDAMQAQHAADLSARDEQQGYVTRQLIAREERDARAELAKDVPQIATDDALWATVREQCKPRARAAISAGRSWQDVLVSDGRRILSPNIRQSEQAKLATARVNTLRATPERGTERTSPARALSKDDKDELAIKKLEEGKSAREVYSELHD